MFTAFRKLFAYAGPRKGYWYRALVFDVIRCVFEALQFFPLFIVLKNIIENTMTPAVAWTALAIMAVSIAGQAVTYYFGHRNSMKASYLMCDDKRIEIGDHLKYIPMGFFTRHNLSNITAVCTSVMEDLEGIAGASVVRILVGIIHAVVLICMMMFFDWRIGLIYLAGILAFLLVNARMLAMSRKNSPLRLSAQVALNDAALEFVQGMAVARAFRLDKQADTKMANAIESARQESYKLEKKSIPYTVAQQAVLRLFSVVGVVASLAFTFAGTMDVFVCLLMIVAAFFVYAQIELAGALSFMLPTVEASIDCVDEIGKIPTLEGNEKPESGSCEIEFDRVSFSYEGKTTIKEASLVIPERSTCAIVGPSGSGKTTLVNLMTRFWDVDEGRVTLGGRDVCEMEPDHLMSHFSMVFQEVYLFNDTIENNIRFGRPDAAREEVVAAARAACCDGFIGALPKGYETMLGEGGATISGGEKQRISIARAILKDAPIVILDEATANVDPENEYELQHAIEALKKDKTIVMIAHRLKTVKHADQILVLDQGAIVDRGTHTELMARKGIYADFVAMRTRAIGWKLGSANALRFDHA